MLRNASSSALRNGPDVTRAASLISFGAPRSRPHSRVHGGMRDMKPARNDAARPEAWSVSPVRWPEQQSEGIGEQCLEAYGRGLRGEGTGWLVLQLEVLWRRRVGRETRDLVRAAFYAGARSRREQDGPLSN